MGCPKLNVGPAEQRPYSKLVFCTILVKRSVERRIFGVLMSKKLNALVVDSNVPRRNQLKSVLKMISGYDEVVFARDQHETIRKFEDSETSFDIAFVSAEDSEEFESILAELKGRKDCKYLIIIPFAPEDASGGVTLEQLVLQGAHGYLQEPFSVDEAQAQTANAIKELARMRVDQLKEVIVALIADCVITIDQVTQHLRLGQGPGQLLQKLRAHRKSISELDPTLHEFYFDTVIEHFMQAEPAAPLDIPEDKLPWTTLFQLGGDETGYSLELLSRLNKRRLICHGDWGVEQSIRDFWTVIEKLDGAKIESLVINFSDAENLGMDLVKAIIQAQRALSKNKINVMVQGDDGLVKDTINRIRAARAG